MRRGGVDRLEDRRPGARPAAARRRPVLPIVAVHGTVGGCRPACGLLHHMMAPASTAVPSEPYPTIMPVEMQSMCENPLRPPGICPCLFMGRCSAPAGFPDLSVLK